MNVSCARSSASAWLPAVSLRSVARTADWCRRTSSEKACRSSTTTTLAISSASLTGGIGGSCASVRPGGRTDRRRGACGLAGGSKLPLLEPPEDEITDADEEEHEPDAVRRSVVED